LGEQSQSSGATVFIGTGSCGEVVAVHEWKLHCQAVKKNTGEQLTSIDSTSPTVLRRIKQVESIEQEFRCLQHLQHPNLVCYLDMSHHQNGDIIDIEVVTEFVTGYSLSVLIQHKCQLSEEVAVTILLFCMLGDNDMVFFQVVQAYARQFLEALYYLHSNAVVHRNVKASSVFVDCKGNLRLADYCIYQR
jgi:serine/threonine protein kinase